MIKCARIRVYDAIYEAHKPTRDFREHGTYDRPYIDCICDQKEAKAIVEKLHYEYRNAKFISIDCEYNWFPFSDEESEEENICNKYYMTDKKIFEAIKANVEDFKKYDVKSLYLEV